MTITFSDVYGINVDNSRSESRLTNGATDNSGSYNIDDNPADDPKDSTGTGDDASGPSGNSPGDSNLPVPEPTTLIVLASGLVVIYAARFGKRQG
jgi:hypothetical protein